MQLVLDSCANPPKYYLVLKLKFTVMNPLAGEVLDTALRSKDCRRVKGWNVQRSRTGQELVLGVQN
jgi:hypothetical protein